jgi:hypothetical protein
MPKCQRCSTETKVYHCSWYNDQNICPTCKKEEQARSDYAECKKSEIKAVQSGDLNFMFKPAWTIKRG